MTYPLGPSDLFLVISPCHSYLDEQYFGVFFLLKAFYIP